MVGRGAAWSSSLLLAVACGDVGSDVVIGERAGRSIPEVGPVRSEGAPSRALPVPVENSVELIPSAPMPLETALANLTITEAWLPEVAVPGTHSQIQFQVRNDGASAAPSVAIRFEALAEEAFEIASDVIPELAPGDAFNGSVTWEVRESFPADTYFVDARVDPEDLVRESNEFDNDWFGHKLYVSHVRVEPLELDFSATAPGCAQTESVTLHNPGDLPVTIGQFRLASSASEFSIQGASFPLTIAAGEQVEVGIRFNPTHVASHRTRIDLTTEFHRSPIRIPVFASSEQYPLHVDTQVQDEAKVDVLMILDDHPEMASEHDQLRPYLVPMLRRLEGQPAHVRIGLTVPRPGVGLLGPVIDSRSAHAVHDLMAQTFPPPDESEARMLEAAVDVVRNHGAWLRPDAGLSILLVSTRDDASELDPQVYVEDLLAHRNDLGAHRTTANSVQLDGSQRCDGDVALRAATFVHLLGGLTDPICDVDSYEALWSLPNDRFGVGRHFDIRKPMRPRTLAVRVDGAGVAPTELNSSGRSVPVWTETAGGQVVFSEGRQPLPGSTIELEYVLECR